MNFDWQTVAVALIVAGALLYVARRALTRLRSFGAPKAGGCSTGCGTCGDADAPLRPSKQTVQIGRPKSSARGRN